MNRSEIKSAFGEISCVVLPVIHVIDFEQTTNNIQKAMEGGCKGVFLINHDFGVERFLPIAKATREAFPDFWIGLNFLSVTGKKAFPVLAELQNGGTRIDAYWADDARIDERRDKEDQPEAEEIASIRKDCGWNGLYFGGTAFKKQREVNPADYAKSAMIARNYMDVVTTSGVATGQSADLDKINTFREACGDTAVGLASGVTPENVDQYSSLVDVVLVATGINFEGDFYNIDPRRLTDLMRKLKTGDQT